jgi:hypothetical protein
MCSSKKSREQPIVLAASPGEYARRGGAWVVLPAEVIASGLHARDDYETNVDTVHVDYLNSNDREVVRSLFSRSDGAHAG